MTKTTAPFAVGNWLVEPSMNRISTAAESIHLRPQFEVTNAFAKDIGVKAEQKIYEWGNLISALRRRLTIALRGKEM